MKKTRKKILGLLGLVFVVALTFVAAFIPGPEASAAGEVSVKDTLVVRVIGSQPRVAIAEPQKTNTDVVNPNQKIVVTYENVEKAIITLKYTDQNGVEHTEIIGEVDADYASGTFTYDLDLNGDNYGYGKYEIIVEGTSEMTYDVEDTLTFTYYPVTVSAEENDTNGKIEATLDYDETNENIKEIVLEVYDENGNITKIPAITVLPPQKVVELPFAQYNLPDGKYTIKATAYNQSGEVMYIAYDYLFYYKKTGVPNTGGLLGGLNISKADYLITGLIIFSLTGAAGLWFVAKNKRKSGRR